MRHIVYIALSYGVVAFSVGAMIAWIVFAGMSGKKRLAELNARLGDIPIGRN